MDSVAVRASMVQKLAAQGVADKWVLQAMNAVERHRFVDPALVNQAYEDTSLPIGLGQTISKPNVVARMMELLRHGQPGKLGRVLEIGTGCGYQAAVLSHLATEVYSIERLRGLHDKARDNLRPFRLAQCAPAVRRRHGRVCQGRTLCGHHCCGRGRGPSAALAGAAGGGRAAGGADGDGRRTTGAGGR
jgi:protein-L-isoaspartate(D-aspartate) O-methyltransferase